MTEAAADTATTDTGEQTEGPADTSSVDETSTMAEIAALAEELGITPGQLKGRLDASRKWEERAKSNSKAQKELDELKRTAMTDQERAIAEARDSARAEVTKEFGSQLATEAIRGAAAGRVGDVEAFVDGIDAAKFLNDDGQVDRDAITAWLDRVAPKPDTGTFPDLGQGQRQAQAPNSDDAFARTLLRQLGR